MDSLRDPQSGERLELERTEPSEPGDEGRTQVRASDQWRYDASSGRYLLTEATGDACSECPATGVRYSYGNDSQLKRIDETDGTSWRYGYDDRGRLLELDHQPAGAATVTVLEYAYEDSYSRPSSISLRSVSDGALLVSAGIDYAPATATGPQASESAIGWRVGSGRQSRSGVDRSCLAVCMTVGAAAGGTLGAASGGIVVGAGGTILAGPAGTVGGAVVGADVVDAGGALLGGIIGSWAAQVICPDASETDGSSTTTADTTNGDDDEDPECEEIRGNLRDALYNDPPSGSGRKSIFRRIIQQMCGDMIPGTIG